MFQHFDSKNATLGQILTFWGEQISRWCVHWCNVSTRRKTKKTRKETYCGKPAIHWDQWPPTL